MGILILSHMGFSFLEDLSRVARQLALKVFVLSSKPAAHASDRYEKVNEVSDWSSFTEESSLKWSDVEKALERIETETGQLPKACITVWEAYRAWMAQANAWLRSPDNSVEAILQVTDKWYLRESLRRNGLRAYPNRPHCPSVIYAQARCS
jgi:hypothetical protein